MLSRSITRFFPLQYGIRCVSTSTVDIVTEIKQYPFLKTFLYDPDDPVKKKWDMIKSYSDQCQRNPQIAEKQFKFIRQRYELLPLYEQPELTENNSFLKDIFERIKDDTQYDKPNMKTLSDLQFDVARRVMNDDIAKRKFIAEIPQLMEKAKADIDKLPFKKFDYANFERQVVAFATYKFISYGHPYMVSMYQQILQKGTLDVAQIADIVYYTKQIYYFKYSSSKEFNEALKWLSRMNWVFEDDVISNNKESLYSKELKNYFGQLERKYQHMKTITEDEDTLRLCSYHSIKEDAIITPDTKAIELWLCRLARKDSDPLITYLKENISGERATIQDLQNAIINRYQLDIGGLMDKHSDILTSLLVNDHYKTFDQTGEISKHREQVLMGKELTSDYMNELKELITNVGNEFRKSL